MTLFSLPLVLPRASLYSRLGVSPEASADEIRAAAARYDTYLKACHASREALAAAHATNLESAAQRIQYDAGYPPLALMRLEATWSSVFEDRVVALAMVRKELERFLAQWGESVFYPSDITRQDFTGDFTYCSLIDDRESPYRAAGGTNHE